jgi:AcrR family transcriptional regulator
VPSNRSWVDRDQKVEEILDAAEAALRAGGFEGLSIAGLARDLGRAQNTIYWYVKDKDGLLVAVVERASKEALSDLAGLRGRGPIELVLSAVDRLADMKPLVLAMRQRSPHSEDVRAYEDIFDSSLRSLLRDVLRPLVPRRRIEDVADAFELAAQGALLAELTAARRRRLLRQLLEALIDAAVT